MKSPSKGISHTRQLICIVSFRHQKRSSHGISRDIQYLNRKRIDSRVRLGQAWKSPEWVMDWHAGTEKIVASRVTNQFPFILHAIAMNISTHKKKWDFTIQINTNIQTESMISLHDASKACFNHSKQWSIKMMIFIAVLGLAASISAIRAINQESNNEDKR